VYSEVDDYEIDDIKEKGGDGGDDDDDEGLS